MFFLSFPPKIFPYCKKIALFSKQLGWATHFHQHKFCVLFSTKLQPIDELHFPLFLFIFLSYLTPKVSGLSKHSDISPSLESFFVLSSFLPLPFSLLLFIRNDNKTKWELTAQLVFDSQMFAEDQMRHFVQSGAPSKFRIVSPSTVLSRSADAAFYSLFPLWFQHLNSMFWRFRDPYLCSTLIYEI